MGQEEEFGEKLDELWERLDPKATVGALPAEKRKDIELFCHRVANDLIRDNADISAAITAGPDDDKETRRERLVSLLVVSIVAGFATGHNWVSEHWTLWGGKDERK